MERRPRAGPRPRARPLPLSSSGAGGTDYGGSYVIDSDAAKHRHAVDPDDDSGETSDAVVTLASAYALDTFKTDSEGWWPGPPPLVGFNGAFSPEQNRARLDFRAEGGYSIDDGNVDASYKKRGQVHLFALFPSFPSSA